jgi:ribonuclease HI
MMAGWAARWKKRDWWRTNKERATNFDLWEKLLALCEKHQVKFQWIKGHAGNTENECCDRLCCAALRQKELPLDEGYENKPDPNEERPPLTEEGEPCWKCGTPVIKRTSLKKPRGEYYFEYFLYCPKCETAYTVEQARRTIEKPPSLL